MADVIKKELDVTSNGENFVFKIPTIHDDIRIGMRSREIRKRLVGPSGDSREEGLDDLTVFLCQSCATMEILLLQGPQWAFSPGPDKKPVVDSANFDEDASDNVMGAVLAYREALRTFRDQRATNQQPAGA